MRKITGIFLFLTILCGITSFKIHKFYVSIYQIEHNVAKKRVEITSRIFVDDLNKVLTTYANAKTQIGDATETADDVTVFKKYLSERFKITINGKSATIQYKSKEIVGDQLVCYFTIFDVPKIKTLQIENTALFEINLQQQNIINTKINAKKQSLILISNKPKGMLKF